MMFGKLGVLNGLTYHKLRKIFTLYQFLLALVDFILPKMKDKNLSFFYLPFYNSLWNASPSISTEWRHMNAPNGLTILPADQTYYLTSRASQQFVTSLN